MNILFISPDYNPFVGTGWGSVQRTNLLFEACTQLGHVDVITFADNVTSTRENCAVRYAKPICQKHKERRINKFLQMLMPWTPYAIFPKNSYKAHIVKQFIQQKEYDLIVCHYIPAAMECGLLDYADKLIIDVDDSPLDVARTMSLTARTWRNRLYHRYRAAIMGHVLKVIQHSCRFTFFANPHQAIYPNSAYLPNIPFYDIQLPMVDFNRTTNRILFVGNMSYGPNSKGVLHFVEYVFPQIKQQIPDAELHLVGGCNNEHLLQVCSKVDGVQYMGFVDDLKEEYMQAKVVAVPIYGGAGTNIKVLEAMQMNRPCVTTMCGMRGFQDYFHNNQEILIAKDDEHFAFAIISLLRDENKNHQIAQQAKQVVSTHFSREKFNTIVKQNIVKL